MALRIEKTPAGFVGVADFNTATLVFELSKFHEKNEALTCFVQVSATTPDQSLVIFRGRTNLTSTRSRNDLARHLAKLTRDLILEEIPWTELIDGLSNRILAMYYAPPELKRITPSNPEIEFLLEPLLVKGHPSLIYAPGGAGKSFLAMFIALLVQNGLDLNFQKTRDPINVLYLDWEMDEHEAQRRFAMLTQGDSDLMMPFYSQCVIPLADIIDNILQPLLKNDIKLVVIDSAAPALGGDINDASQVIRFFGAVRQLTATGITVLILTHVSKAHKEKDDAALPIGSVYFVNLSRLTWELKYHVEGHAVDLALFCRKSNFGKMPSVGFKLIFEDGFVFVSKLRNPDALGTTKDLTQKEAILSVLLEGPATVKEIADAVGISKEQVWARLAELKREGKVRSAGRGIWEAAQ
jgi:hypothetical protein